MTPHQRGRADYRAGKHFTENPYKDAPGIDQAYWLTGWNKERRANMHEHTNISGE